MKIRIANRTEIGLISEFYAENRSHFVKERMANALDRAVQEDRCLVISNDKAIHGVCFVFGDQVREIGGIRVALNGFGLQTKLMAIQAVTQFLTDAPLFETPDEKYPMIAITAKDNIASIKSITKVGFSPIDNASQGLLQGLGIDELDENKKYFHLPYEKDSLQVAANIVTDLFNTSVLTNKTGDTLTLDLHDLPLMNSGLFETLLNKRS